MVRLGSFAQAAEAFWKSETLITLGSRSCILTGANGFVGSRLKGRLERDGWRVVAWTRQPQPGTGEVAFHLGQDVDSSLLKGAQALVHCAYDFGPRRWEDIAAVNVAGSQELFSAARAAGVRSVVFVSSLSAFAGCQSLYGKAKVEIEGFAQSMGAFVIRPGLVYSDNPGGMFGRLVRQVRDARFVPIIWGGRQVQYLLHDEDLGNLVQGCLAGRVPAGVEPITIAHEQGWELKEILTQIARALGKRVTFVPVPWQLAWLGLKSLEFAGAQPNFRSDSLISLVYQNPRPFFALLMSLGFQCRPFQLSPAMLAQSIAL
jgi:nucleoside-diphosphate-sugar epimerase